QIQRVCSDHFLKHFVMLKYMLIPMLLFFLQAEDVIRNKLVTGVQTCALPIFSNDARIDGLGASVIVACAVMSVTLRSAERRVGEECRYRRSPHHYNTDRV